MISIDICDSCEKKYDPLFENCPIWQQIQNGMNIINKAMVKAHKQRRLLGVVASEHCVVASGHWLAQCNFECRFCQPKKEVDE